MGSLMAGWDSYIPDPQVVKYKRNKSLTKEEIEALWRSKKHREEDEVTNSASSQTQIHDHQANDETLNSNDDYEEKLIKKHGWWVSSSLAHLNEPPVLPPQERNPLNIRERVGFWRQQRLLLTSVSRSSNKLDNLLLNKFCVLSKTYLASF